MRGFAISILLLIILVVSFIFGVLNAQTGLMIAGFCLTPFVLIGLGWSLHGLFAGRRVALVEVERRSPTPAQQPRRRTAVPSTQEGHTL